MELKEIKAVIDLMTRNGLTEFELERKDFKIRVKRGYGTEAQISVSPAQLIAQPLVTPIATAAPESKPGDATGPALPTINSPMVGTFYRSPSPDSPAFVDVGSEVKEDTVVCIIEAMKVMNEIKAEIRGTIVEVLQDNGKPVEFGKPLFKIKPA